MSEGTWKRIVAHLENKFHSSPLLPRLHSEVRALYDDTIRRTTGESAHEIEGVALGKHALPPPPPTVRMALVKPSVNRLEPEPDLYKEQE